MDTVISTLIGGFLALGGALIGPFFARRHEKWRARRDDEDKLRLKAEELFDELDRLNQHSHASLMSVIKVYKGKAGDVLPVPDLGKVRAIVTVYFPSAQSIVDDFETERARISGLFIEYFQQQMKDGGLRDVQISQMQTLMITNHQKIIAEISKALRAHVSAVVPRLK